MVDSLDLSTLSSPTKGLYEELPAFPFLHHTPQTVNDIVRSEFPGTALNCALFVILDSFSAENGTCIIAENLMRDDPFLMLVRMEFHNAMAVPVSTTLTGMRFDPLTESAMEKDGVNRFWICSTAGCASSPERPVFLRGFSRRNFPVFYQSG